tara:strand:+ start:1999 stop:2244 length:246 start_codon:yes stop_codon:yes gene_type:complete
MKLIVSIANKKYILTPDQYDAVMDVIADVPMYETQYHRAEGSVASYYTHHVFERIDTKQVASIEALSEGYYALAKLAGRPE